MRKQICSIAVLYRRTVISSSEEQTRHFGRWLGEVLRPADVVGLQGPLGAGKTALVRGIAEGLGFPAEAVRSPTFTLINEYRGGRVPLYHVDLYRLDATEWDLLALGEVFESGGVSVVEWCERAEGEPFSLRVRLDIVDAHSRRLEFTAREVRLVDWLEKHEPVSEDVRSWR